MTERVLVTTFLAALVLAGELPAQRRADGCPDIYPAPRVGDYADLRISGEQTGVVAVRFAIVGTENVDGSRHYWMEVMQTPPNSDWSIIAQILIPHFPFEQQDIRGYVVKMPDQPPVRVPLEMLELLGEETAPAGSWSQVCTTAEDLGIEEVTVPAGTLTARHYRGAKGDLWIADVPFGTVKTVEPDMVTVLVGYGHDARSSITEKPQLLELPPGSG